MKELWIHPLGYGPVLLKKFIAAGWSSFLVDLEHNYLTEEQVMSTVHVINGLRGSAIVRPATPDPGTFIRLLETGATRFLLAGIDEPGPLLRLRDAMHEHSAYVDDIAKIQIIPMIESRKALDNLAGIASLDFIGGVHFGPNDLARDLGIASAVDLDALLRYLEPAWRLVRSQGKRVGNFIHTDWFERFPFDAIDIGSVASQQLLNVRRVGLPVLQNGFRCHTPV